MKTRTLFAAIAATSLSFAGAAFAQGDGGNAETGAAHHDTRPQTNLDRGEPERGQPQRGQPEHGQPQHGQPEHQAYNEHGHPGHQEGRGAGPSHNFYKGGRLPAEYRDHRYVVHDWHSHHLSAPPRGYQWVQTGDDFVLAAIATGVIASVLLNSH